MPQTAGEEVPSQSVSLLHYFELWLRFKPDQEAFADWERRMTWREADRLSSAVAGQFQAWGVKRGDRIGCFLTDSVDWCVMIVASLKCGATIAPLNHRYGSFDLQQILALVDCKAFISTPTLMRRLFEDRDFPESDEITLYHQAPDGLRSIGYAEAVAAAPSYARVQRHEEDLAAICFTSGTTGVPKGVMLTDRGVANMCTGMLHAYAWSHHGRILTFSPMAFTGGTINMFMSCLISGGFFYIPQDFKPQTALDLIQQEKITFFGAVPPLWDAISQCPGFADADLSSLTSGIAGGSPVARHVLEAFLAKGVLVRQAYGATEGCGTVTLPSERMAVDKCYAAGRPILNMELRVVNEAFEDCAPGETGEIVYRGRNMMKGYWRNPEATASAFRDGWYLTGDLGRLDEDGDLQVLDRKKNMIISGGVNVYPAEVERALRTMPLVNEVAVFGMPHPRWGEAVIAIVRMEEGCAVDEGEFRTQARAMLGDFKTPKEFVFTHLDFPRTASTKLGRTELPNFYRSLTGG